MDEDWELGGGSAAGLELFLQEILIGLGVWLYSSGGEE